MRVRLELLALGAGVVVIACLAALAKPEPKDENRVRDATPPSFADKHNHGWNVPAATDVPEPGDAPDRDKLAASTGVTDP